MRMWSQLVNLATLKMCKSSTAIFSVACGNTVQSSYLNSAPTEVEYLVNSVTSSLCTTLHTLALLKKEGNKSEIPENADSERTDSETTFLSYRLLFFGSLLNQEGNLKSFSSLSRS